SSRSRTGQVWRGASKGWRRRAHGGYGSIGSMFLSGTFRIAPAARRQLLTATRFRGGRAFSAREIWIRRNEESHSAPTTRSIAIHFQSSIATARSFTASTEYSALPENSVPCWILRRRFQATSSSTTGRSAAHRPPITCISKQAHGRYFLLRTTPRRSTALQ